MGIPSSPLPGNNNKLTIQQANRTRLLTTLPRCWNEKKQYEIKTFKRLNKKYKCHGIYKSYKAHCIGAALLNKFFIPMKQETILTALSKYLQILPTVNTNINPMHAKIQAVKHWKTSCQTTNEWREHFEIDESIDTDGSDDENGNDNNISSNSGFPALSNEMIEQIALTLCVS